MIEIKENKLYIDGVSGEALAETYGTPLFAMSHDYIAGKCEAIRKDFLNKYPLTRAAYAGKAFLTLAMCQIIEEEGFCLDVVSGGELYTAISAGFPSERIEFNGNNKSEAEIEMAIEYGVGRIIVDGADEIQLIDAICKKYNKTIDVLLRISPGVDSHTHSYITTGNVDSKFGVPLEPSIFYAVFDEIMATEKVNLIGFHYHIGSQLHENDSYIMATEILVDLLESVYKERNFIAQEINIGGGFGIRYTEADEEKTYAYFLDPVMALIYGKYETMNWNKPAVVIEPGRSIVANAGVTLYRVGTIKNIPGVRKYVAVDGGMTDNIRPALYQSPYEFHVDSNGPKETVAICGKCCESGDILAKEVAVNQPKRGDLLAVLSTGAYCYAMSSNYNKIPMLPVVMVKEGKEKLIVKRQSYEDLISREIKL